MPVIMTPPPSPPADSPPNAPPTLTVTYYQQLAAHFSEVLDEISAIIPRVDKTVLGARFVSTHLNVPTKFLGTAVASVEQVAALQNAGTLDVNRGRDTLQLLDAFRPIRDKVAAFEQDLRQALDACQAALAVEALDIYSLAKSLARNPNNAALGSWVANMRRDLGRRGPKSPKPAAVPDPAADPVPVQVPTTWVPEKPQRGNG